MKNPNEFALQLSPATCQQLAALYNEECETFAVIVGSLFKWIAGGMKEKCVADKDIPMLAKAFLANLAESHYTRFTAYRTHRKQPHS